MILTVLADNRRISFAFFDKNDAKFTPLCTFSLSAQPARTADEYAVLLESFHKRAACATPQSAILACVVPPLAGELCQAVKLLFGDIPCLTVGAGLRSGLILRTDAPAELGADLVAMAVGAATLRKPPFLVLHCGEVTTLSAVDADKDAPVYLGCAILPGATSPEHIISLFSRMEIVLSMRLHALVFAAGHGVPLVGAVYDPKVSSFLDAAGQDLYTPLEQLTAPILTAHLDAAAARVKDRALREESVRKLRVLEEHNSICAKALLDQP